MSQVYANGTFVSSNKSIFEVVQLNAAESHIGEIGGRIIIPTATFTRPSNTTAYVSGQLIANSVTAGSVTPMSITAARANDKSGLIRKASVRVNNIIWLNATVRVHLFSALPTVTNGDGGTFLPSEASWIGSIDVSLTNQFSNPAVKGNGSPNVGGEINFVPAAGTQLLYALLEARSAVTPGSGDVFVVGLESHQN